MSKRINSAQHARNIAVNGKASSPTADALGVVPGIIGTDPNAFVQAAAKAAAGKHHRDDPKAHTHDGAQADDSADKAQSQTADDTANATAPVESTASGAAHMVMTALDMSDMSDDQGGSGGSGSGTPSVSHHHDNTLPIALGVGALAIGGGVAAAVSGGSSSTPVPTPTPVTNHAPTFGATTQSVSVAENTAIATTVLTATATDADAGDTITYTLGGADAALFAVSSTGAVTFKASPNFENPTDAGKDNVYNFTVTATDKAGTTAVQTETVTVTNANEAPTITSAASTPPIAENSATTTVVYTATATDPEGNPITFSLTGADAAFFNISNAAGTAGQVTLTASPDFEAKSSYSFNVVATDNANPALSSAPVALTLGITNVNEAPQLGNPTATATTIAENGTTGATVFSTPAKGGDPDAGDTVTFSLSGTDAGLFDISSAGVVSFKAGINANFEANASHSYSFIVTAKDAAGLSDTQTVTLPITNVIDNLSLDQGNFSTPTVVTINANGVTGTDVGNVDYRFNETPGTQSNVVINNFSANDFIQFTGADPVDYSYQVSGSDLTLTYQAAGNVLSKIVLAGAVNAGASVNSEATAEAALAAHLGATTNPGGYLVGLAPPATVNDDTLAGAQTVAGATFDAAGAAVTFNDDGALASTVTIAHFRSDDHINLTNVGPTGNLGSTVLFSNAAGDPAHDIQIDFFINGQHTAIILDDVNLTGQGVNNLATAQAVLGANFITFA